VKIDITKGGMKYEIVTMDFGFPDDDNATNKNMDLPRWYWEAGVPTNQPQDRIDAWTKAQKLRHNKETGQLIPNFKTEKDAEGKERWYVYRKRRFTWVEDWLRQAIMDKTLGLGKMNDYMLTDEASGDPLGLNIKYYDRDFYENITGEPDDR